MRYVNLEITTPQNTLTTQIRTDEFINYIAPSVLNKYAESNNEDFFSNLKDNFNNYSPQNNNGCSCYIAEETDKKSFKNFNLNLDRLDIAQYCLNNYLDPIEPLQNISSKLYEYKEVFDGKLLYLVNNECIDNARNSISKFNNSILDISENLVSERNR